MALIVALLLLAVLFGGLGFIVPAAWVLAVLTLTGAALVLALVNGTAHRSGAHSRQR